MSLAHQEPAVLATIRRIILGLVALGTVGMIAELILVGHYDDPNQLIPLAVAAAGLLTVLWVAVSPRVPSLQTLQFVMLTYAGTGVIGIALHYQANVKLVREKEPSLTGWPLLRKGVESPAPPALAPGIMIQLGLLGLAFTYRHPALRQESISG